MGNNADPVTVNRGNFVNICNFQNPRHSVFNALAYNSLKFNLRIFLIASKRYNDRGMIFDELFR
jgi:hypothetical protein